ncbi:MAG: hypothetical protein F4Z28_13300 [Gammaproteobacteria bacterium]|nr:hypothetical protein [Gammaproteobacteria bacterium]
MHDVRNASAAATPPTCGTPPHPYRRLATVLLFFSTVFAPSVAGADGDGYRTITLGPSAGDAIPVLGLRPGHLTTVSFRDTAGAPRPILG